MGGGLTGGRVDWVERSAITNMFAKSIDSSTESVYLLKTDFIHDVLGGHDVLVGSPNELHCEGHRPIGSIKVEEA